MSGLFSRILGSGFLLSEFSALCFIGKVKFLGEFGIASSVCIDAFLLLGGIQNPSISQCVVYYSILVLHAPFANNIFRNTRRIAPIAGVQFSKQKWPFCRNGAVV